MSKLPGATVSVSPQHRTNLRMSKFSRMAQSQVAQTNWTDMAKMLFWGDDDQGRQDVIVKLLSYKRKTSKLETGSISYATEQTQYLLSLMLILTIAEKRTQEVYQNEFSKRCDAISIDHGLEESQYWSDGKVPAEWKKLDAEFEQRSTQILQDTLREYSMNEIADQVQEGGANQFFNIISNIETQFLKVLKQPRKDSRKKKDRDSGSIPETLSNS